MGFTGISSATSRSTGRRCHRAGVTRRRPDSVDAAPAADAPTRRTAPSPTNLPGQTPRPAAGVTSPVDERHVGLSSPRATVRRMPIDARRAGDQDEFPITFDVVPKGDPDRDDEPDGYLAGKADVGAKHSTPPMPGTRGSGIEIVDATLPADLAAEIARDDHASRVVAELRDLERRGLA